MQAGASQAVYDDIERELYQLGLSEGPPRTFNNTAIYPKLPPHELSRQSFRQNARLYNRSYDDRFFDPESGRYIRSSSAPAVPFERQLSNPDELFLLSGLERIRGVSSGTRSLNDIEPLRPRSSSHGAASASCRNHFRPLVSSAPITSWQNPSGVHYPGYVQLKDFLTLPRGAYDKGEEEFLTAEEEVEADAMEKQLIASVEAVLRKVHAGIQESYIRYDFPDSITEPPPPQPVGASLRDPPPSPEPPHNNVTPPRPALNGHYIRLPTNRHGLVQRTTSEPLQFETEEMSQPRLGPRSSLGSIGTPQLIDPDNASLLSQQMGFIPIQDPSAHYPSSSPSRQGSSKTHHRHRHHHHHRYFEEAAAHHIHHQRKKSSKALRRISNIAAIARGSGIKIVKIHKVAPPGPGFGFSIKGSLEKGLGVYVSRVEQSGPAWIAGLRQGDLLLAANNQPVSQMSHTEIISLLKSSEEISLTVAGTSPLSAPVVVSQSYSWVTSDLRPTSPPAEFNPRKHSHQVSTIVVVVNGADGLGLMIRGGAEYGLGVFITGVDAGSAAHKAGLLVGDQILEVNGESFLAVTHDTAVRVLKYSRHLEMSIRRIGKVPHSCTTFHRKRSSKTRRKSRSNDPLSENLQATLAMIEEKSKSVLSSGEHSRLHDLVTDYATGRVPVARLLQVAAQVLNSPDKLSLLTELREVVKTSDLGEFDATVFSQSSNLSIQKSEFYTDGEQSPTDIDSINKMVRSLQLNMDNTLKSISPTPEEKLLLDSSSEQIPNHNSQTGSKKKRKGVTRQKERKRNKKFIENESDMLNSNIFQNESNSSFMRSSSTKFKTSLKPRKFLKKRLSEKSLISKDDFDYPEASSSSRHHLTISGEDDNPEDRLFDTQGGGTSQASYFGHSLSDAALHTVPPFERHCRSLSPLGKNNVSHSFNSLLFPKVSSPLFSPTSPILSPSSILSYGSRDLAESHFPSFSYYEDPKSSQYLRGTHGEQVNTSHDATNLEPFFDLPEEGFSPMKNIQNYSDFRQSRLGHLDFPMYPRSSNFGPSDTASFSQPSMNRDPRNYTRDSSGFYSHPPMQDRMTSHRFQDTSFNCKPTTCLNDSAKLCPNDSGQNMPARKNLPPHTCVGGASGSRTSMVVSDKKGRFRVIVQKTRLKLGIAIEGGSNTKHNLPRVINIASSGAAFEAGGLRVGQLIMAVNGIQLEGKTHEEVAKLIAECWSEKSKGEIEFSVVDKKQTDAEIRRSSISLLSQVS